MGEEQIESNGSLEASKTSQNGLNKEVVEDIPQEGQEVSCDSEKLSELEQKIIRQIEYYFGDINLGRDKFLQEQIKLEDGWVYLETLLKFNRLANLSKDRNFIADTMEKSVSGLIEISKDKLKIRRSPNKPIPEMNEERRKELMFRTVYCKGFPKEGTDIDKLLDFFNKHDKVENVVMRNYRDKAAKAWFFKGSIFVVFPTVEGAKSFLSLENVKYEDTELVKMSQEDYIEMKRKERLEFKIKAAKKSEEDEIKRKAQEEEKKEKEEKKTEVPSGCIVKLKCIPHNTTREVIKKKIEDLGFSVAFVDMKRNDEEGWVRLDEQDSAKQLIKKLEEVEGKIKLSEEEEVTVEMPSEEEETAYTEKVKDILSKKFKGNDRWGKGRRRGGGRQGGRGRGGWNNRKRKGSNEEGPKPSKIKITD